MKNLNSLQTILKNCGKPKKKLNFTLFVINTDDDAELKSPSDIAYHFNNLFRNTGQSQANQSQINAKRDNTLNYLKNKLSKSLFLAPTYS